MKVLLWGLLIFASAMLLHLVIWRVSLPGRQTRALMKLFAAALLGGSFLLSGPFKDLSLWGVPAPQHPAEYLHMALLVVSLALMYIVFYSALEADSPSLVMILTIARAGEGGVEKGYFRRVMNDEVLVMPRIRDLLRDKLVCVEDGCYRLTAKGKTAARIFNFYRALLRAEHMGG